MRDTKLKASDPVGKIPLIGGTHAKQLGKLGITTVRDLLWHLPFDYHDFRNTTDIGSSAIGEIVTLKGAVKEIKNIFTKNKKKITQAVIADSSGQINLVWFNQFYLTNSLKKGTIISVCGKVEQFSGKKTIIGPDYEIVTSNNQKTIHTGRLVPKYPSTRGISSKWVRSRINFLLENYDWESQIESPPNEETLIKLRDAQKEVHFPKDEKKLREARERIAYEEMFWWQVKNEWLKDKWQANSETKSFAINKDTKEIITQIISKLPFKLTSSQKRCLSEINEDLTKKIPMNRILQGDVGSGKTIVAALAALPVLLTKSKVLYLAPTQTLANQQYEEIKNIYKSLKISVGLVTSNKKENIKGDILIGTHSLLFSDFFEDVGLVIIDEQHRFGVEQRNKLINKKIRPHLLTMTATPIPRTLFLTVLGHLSVSSINELPEGRIATKTWVVPENKRMEAYRWVEKKVEEGNKVFIICPLIEESEKETMAQIRSVKKEFDDLKKIYFKYNLELLHGKMKPDEKEQSIKNFKFGKSQILVATSVVEVGVHIPKANVIIIEGAERFGIASLHQLRGRVGREKEESYCLLFTTQEKTDISRLKLLEQHKDGLSLAEADLKLRGPGSFFGTAQHGIFIDFKVASLFDIDLAKKAKKKAQEFLKEEKNQENIGLIVGGGELLN